MPGTLERLGLADDILWAANPALVHGVISGYGQSSGRAGWPALDFVVQAHAGILAVTGPDSQTPVKAGVPVADLAAGLYLTIGVLAALRRAEQTGQGERVEVALAEACGSLLANQALNHLIGGGEPVPLGNVHPNLAPYEVLRAQDKALAVAATSERQFARLCGVCGVPELSEDPRFATNPARVAARAELVAILEQRLAQRPASDWVDELNAAGVAAAPINTVSEMLADPDTRAGLVAALPDGTPQLRTPIRLGGRPLALSGAPPALGQDDAAVRVALAAGGDAAATGVPADTVLAAIDAFGATHIVIVPDTSQKTVLDALGSRGTPPLIRAATEDDVLGICAGLWMAGQRPLAIIQQLGLFAAANALRAFTHDQRVPLAILAGLYGRTPSSPVAADPASAVRLCVPLLDALGVRSVLVDSPRDAHLIEPALRAAHDERCTSVVLLGAPTC